jgi:hypothetical protein
MNYVIFLIFALIIVFTLINTILPLFKKEEWQKSFELAIVFTIY